MSWLYVLGLEGSNSGSDSRPPVGLERFVTWNGKPMSRLVLGREWRTGCLRLLRSTLTCEASTVERGVESWISFLRDTRASRSASPGTSSGQRTSSTFGPRSIGSFARFDRASCSWKTSQATFQWDSGTFCETWPQRGSMRNGACFRLPKSARRTSASGYSASLLPTPAAQSYGTNKGGSAGRVGPERPSLETMARKGLWPTPSASLGEHAGLVTPTKGREGGTLVEAVSARLWPTPSASDGEGGRVPPAGTTPQGKRPDGKKAQIGLNTAVRLWPTPTAQDAANNGGPCQQRRNTKPLNAEVGGALNPTWVEWLMGFPLGYSALEPLEMESYRQWQLAHGVNSPKGH